MKPWVLFLAVALHAETGRDAWLRYSPRNPQTMPAVLATLGDSPVVANARDEILRGIRGMSGKTLRLESAMPKENAIVLGTLSAFPNLSANLPADAYWLKTVHSGNIDYTVVTAINDRGVLYGAFALLRKIALGQPIANLDEQQTPYAPIRWVNQWDRLDGSMERGYGGRSIFWDEGTRTPT